MSRVDSKYAYRGISPHFFPHGTIQYIDFKSKQSGYINVIRHDIAIAMGIMLECTAIKKILSGYSIGGISVDCVLVLYTYCDMVKRLWISLYNKNSIVFDYETIWEYARLLTRYEQTKLRFRRTAISDILSSGKMLRPRSINYELRKIIAVGKSLTWRPIEKYLSIIAAMEWLAPWGKGRILYSVLIARLAAAASGAMPCLDGLDFAATHTFLKTRNIYGFLTCIACKA